MLQRLICILLVLAPVLASAQSIRWGDAEYKRIVKDDCEGKVFTKYEELASLKVSQQAFEDSLTTCLKANHAFDSSGKFVMHFLLTTESRMLNPERISGSFPKPGFIKCFEQLSQLWVPAIQNKHSVCAYVKCEIEVKQDRLNIRIFQ